MKYYIGIDGGASKTELVLADEAGKVLAELVSGPTNLDVIAAEEAAANLEAVLNNTFNKFQDGASVENLVFGLAGVDNQEDKDNADKVFTPIFQKFSIKNYSIVNDAWIALASGSKKENAIILIAGTGSNCLGRNQKGQIAKTGGLDFLLAGEGSAYSIGLAVLKAATQSYDGRAKKTILEKLLCEYFKVDSILDLKSKVYQPLLSKKQIAQLAQLCTQAFEQDDLVAKEIFDQAISNLMNMVVTVIKKLDLQDTVTDVVLVGGLTRVTYIKEQLIARIKDFNSQIKPIFPKNSPAHGAIKMAMF
ncbi:MAG: BadF/BadG/BcrA/BcrD ATPase family protein [Candidatus Woesebacteria bacterium]|jgi:N-acetylglucosamine kinase-like BadF-type ATPase